jgi:pimeloyl-ACP methyl ester carboxylesterase
LRSRKERDDLCVPHLVVYLRWRRLVYDEYGEGSRVVVYRHGLLIDSELNRGIAQSLAARGNRVILLDLVGHGRSDKPEHASAYRIDTYADQVFALADELGVERPVLGGMSLGAVRARSPIELRLRPDRLTDVIARFVEELWAPSGHIEPARRRPGRVKPAPVPPQCLGCGDKDVVVI